MLKKVIHELLKIYLRYNIYIVIVHPKICKE